VRSIRCLVGTDTVTAQGHSPWTRHARSGVFHLAETGDRLLATKRGLFHGHGHTPTVPDGLRPQYCSVDPGQSTALTVQQSSAGAAGQKSWLSAGRALVARGRHSAHGFCRGSIRECQCTEDKSDCVQSGARVNLVSGGVQASYDSVYASASDDIVTQPHDSCGGGEPDHPC
jgi:hypothetical protein